MNGTPFSEWMRAEGEVLKASGSWCMPISPMYDFGLREPWEYPDWNPMPLFVPFLRLDAAAAKIRVLRRRVAEAGRVLRGLEDGRIDDWDDE